MSGLSNARVIVAGGGALGSSIALSLAQAGARVVLADPVDAMTSASGVAAGMLAPALESVLDPEAGLPFDLLRAARDLWPAFAARLGGVDIGLKRAGALWLDLPGAPPRAPAIVADLARIGAVTAEPPAATFLTIARDRRVFTPEDWRLDPGATLRALSQAFRAAGGEIVRARLEGFEDGCAWLSDGSRRTVDRLVVATGAQGAELAPELGALIPIKGHILKYPALCPPAGAATIRCADGYATGGADGLCVGATMERGRADLAIDPAIVARLHALAERLYPQAGALTPVALAGVRAASRDGPPVVSPSARAGVLVAAGARRNGWLLAPLVAQIVTAYLMQRDPGPYGALFRPRAPAQV